MITQSKSKTLKELTGEMLASASSFSVGVVIIPRTVRLRCDSSHTPLVVDRPEKIGIKKTKKQTNAKEQLL